MRQPDDGMKIIFGDKHKRSAPNLSYRIGADRFIFPSEFAPYLKESLSKVNSFDKIMSVL
ncbi:hypothetical protein FHS20_001769 [Phyllobacterium endophyticum]|uniref:Uncharacterized protein n=1 Tax=Phyllobacterium endophyticum TaxID=1149773 RepID=A0A2P7AVX5_9HYPH|nr:hypothetical protein [Phyllobacterium endophyticum]PSH58343.1 hypothetical protein CU100_12090 [Phyllobacterium endophyticum]